VDVESAVEGGHSAALAATDAESDGAEDAIPVLMFQVEDDIVQGCDVSGMQGSLGVQDARTLALSELQLDELRGRLHDRVRSSSAGEQTSTAVDSCAPSGSVGGGWVGTEYGGVPGSSMSESTGIVSADGSSMKVVYKRPRLRNARTAVRSTSALAASASDGLDNEQAVADAFKCGAPYLT
jgi:hypothetical protein